jgi:NAD(P)H-quinone oxidoreductase subunit 5
LLFGSGILGCSLSGVIYLGKMVPKPVKFPIGSLQNLVAYDFYTPTLYRNSIVFSVSLLSQLTDWFDKYLVDGFVNLFGRVTMQSGQTLKYSTTGRSQFYMLTILLGLALLGLFLCQPFLSHLVLIFSTNWLNQGQAVG